MSHKAKKDSVQGQAQPNEDPREKYERHIDGHVTVRGQIETHLPPDVSNKKDTERKEDKTQKKKDYRVAVLTLAAVAIYALLTFWQGCLTRESIDNNSRQFQIDQRPYLWTTEKRPETTIQVGRRMWANIELVDFGKSPATKVSIAGKIYIGPTAMADAYKWFDNLGSRPLPASNAATTVVMPGIPSVFPSVAGDSDPTKPAKAPIGGFGGGGFFTLQSDGVLTQLQVDQILQTAGYAVMAMRLQYFDGFGNRYWSDICMYRLENGNIPFCNQHTEVH